jgi:hypothetical protein
MQKAIVSFIPVLVISGVFFWLAQKGNLGLIAFGQSQKPVDTAPKPKPDSDAPTNPPTLTPIPFQELNAKNEPYNASGVVALGDGRFLFCDNNTDDALLELDLTADGQMKGPLIKRPLQGLAAAPIDDMEAMTVAEEKGRRYILVTSSLFIKPAKDGQSLKVPPSGLLRVRVQSDDSLVAENMPGFRDWFIHNAPAITESAKLLPDQGGLNIEGLAWDHKNQTLLFGVRTPLANQKPLVIPVKVKKLSGPWTTDNLIMWPPIPLTLDATGGEQGIRSIEYIPSRKSFLVVVGKAISGAKVPFVLYEWKGDRKGKLHRLNLSFADKMKPEGLTSGTIAGRPVILFTDDGGGFQVLWLDKTRL